MKVRALSLAPPRTLTRARPVAQVRPRRTRLSLLAQFSIVSFVLIAGIGAALAWVVQDQLEQNALRQEAASAADQVALTLAPALRAEDLRGPLAPARFAQIDALVRETLLHDHIVRVKIWNPDGMLLYSDETALLNQRFALDTELQDALAGEVGMDVSTLTAAENATERGRFSRLLEIYVPLRPGGSGAVAGAFEVYHDLAVVQPGIDHMRRMVTWSLALGFLVLYGGLFTLVRRASGDLQRTSGENARLYREARGLYTDLQQSNAELGLAYDTTLEGWSRTLELRDKETEGHTQRVTEMTVRLARALGFDAEALAHVRRGALLHDIGKMGIPDSVLLKPGALTPDEWAIMRLHPVYAYELLRPIAFLRPALDIPYCHHEKWDGSGYPRGLRGTEIPLAARIFAVVDVWDALRSERPYRAAWPEERVRAHIASLAGTHFEPRIVEAFLATAPPLAAAPAPPPAVSLAREPVALSA
jgi:putative nucleotidyltransferase with HDIG domain